MSGACPSPVQGLTVPLQEAQVNGAQGLTGVTTGYVTNTLEGREGCQGKHGPPDSAGGGGEFPPGIKRIGVGEAGMALTSLPKNSF